MGARADRRLPRRRIAIPTVRAVILTGAGRAFCAGADMEFFAGQIAAAAGPAPSGGDGPGRVEEFPPSCSSSPSRRIAAINGYALGVGCTMTLLCDVRLAAEEAKLGFLFPRMGVMAELGSTFLLPRLVGLGRACELMFTGKQYPAAELRAPRAGEPRRAGRRAARRRHARWRARWPSARRSRSR